MSISSLPKETYQWYQRLSSANQKQINESIESMLDELWPAVTDVIKRQLCSDNLRNLWDSHESELRQCYHTVLAYKVCVPMAYGSRNNRFHQKRPFQEVLNKRTCLVLERESHFIDSLIGPSFWYLIRHCIPEDDALLAFKAIVDDAHSRATLCATGRMKRMEKDSPRTSRWLERSFAKLDRAYERLPIIVQLAYKDDYDSAVNDLGYVANDTNYMGYETTIQVHRYETVKGFAEVFAERGWQ